MNWVKLGVVKLTLFGCIGLNHVGVVAVLCWGKLNWNKSFLVTWVV